MYADSNAELPKSQGRRRHVQHSHTGVELPEWEMYTQLFILRGGTSREEDVHRDKVLNS
jgi:hypothetical protein